MTATDPAPLVCPQCGSTSTAIGGSGNGMCFDCAHTWDPASVVALPRPALEPFGMAPVEEVFDAGSAPGEAVSDQDPTSSDWFDTATPPVTEPPNPHDFPETWSGLAQYRAAGGSMSNETWWSDIMGSPPDDLDPAAATDDATPVEVQAALLLASRIVAAGVTAAYCMEQPNAQLMPETGYLPTEKAMLPIVEQACAIAIGMVVDASGSKADLFARTFGIDLGTTEEGNPTPEENHGEGSSEAHE